MRARGPAAPKHAARVPFTVLVLALLGGGMALLLALNTASAANELRRHDLTGQDAGVAAQVQQLQVDVAASAAPDKLAQAAAALGMVPALDPAFLVVGADGAVHLLGSPGPASDAPLVAAHKKKPAASRSATASRTATTTRSPAAGSTSSAGRHGATRGASSTAGRTSSPAPSRTPAATPTPTPTPTPTVTLPGGTR